MQTNDNDLSLKNFFIPFTTVKALHFLIFIGFLLFFNGLFNGFVQDDHAQIVDKPTIQSLSHIGSYFFESRLKIGEQNFIGAMYYKPLLDTTFAVIYSISGAHAFGFHFVQIVFSIINACLSFLLFKKFFTPVLSFFLALIFLIHPIHSEISFYISAMQEVLFLFFGIMALLLVGGNYSYRKILIISTLLLCSLLSKETGMLIVGILIVYTFLFQRKIIFQVLGSVVVAVGIYTFLRVHAIGFFQGSRAVSPIETLGFSERILHIPSIFLYYLKTFLFPVSISSSHQWTFAISNFQNFYFPLLVLIFFITCLVALGIFIYKKDHIELRKVYLFFCLWFFLGISFHLQMLPLDQTVAERWFYFPSIGLLGILGVVWSSISIQRLVKKQHIKILVGILLGIILSLCALKTFLRSFDFRNDFVLASQDIQVSPESYNLEYILSRQYYDQGDLTLAKYHAEKSIALFPQITNYTNLGAIYSRMGEYASARKSYIKALEYGDDALPYENIASVSLVHGNKEESIVFLREKALKKYPKNGKLWFSLALLEYQNGNKKDALIAIDKAKQYYPIPLVQFIGEAFQQHKTVEVKAESGSVRFSVE